MEKELKTLREISNDIAKRCSENDIEFVFIAKTKNGCNHVSYSNSKIEILSDMIKRSLLVVKSKI